MKTTLAALLALMIAFNTGDAFALPRIQNEDIKSLAQIESSAGTITGNLSSGTACIASPSSTAGLASGQFIYDTTTSANIPSGTTITAIPGTCSAGQIQMSANAAGTATADTITFGGQLSQLPNDTKIYMSSTLPVQTLAQAVASGAIGGSGGGNTGKNYLVNPSFEGGLGSWTASGATATLNTSDFQDGSQSVSLALSGAGSYSQDVTPTTNLASTNLESGVWVKTTVSGTKVCARSGGSTLTGNCNSVPTTGAWTYVPSNSVGPTLGTSIGVAVTWTASSGTVQVDHAYTGGATNLSQVSQSYILGAVTIHGCAGAWTTTSTTFATMGTQSGCVYTTSGSATAPSTNINAITFPSMGPGNYTIHEEDSFQQTTAGHGAYFQFTDHTNVANEISAFAVATTNLTVNGLQQTFTYNTAPTGPVTWELYGKTDAGGTANAYGITGQTATITVYFSPLQSQQAVNSNTQNAVAFANNTAGGSYTSGAVFPFTNVVIDTVHGFSAGTYTVSQAGTYEVSTGIYNNTVQISPVSVKHNGTTAQSTFFPGATTGTNVVPPVDFTAVSGDTITVTASGSFTLDASAPQEYWVSIKQIQTQQNAPILVGSVTSTGTGAYHSESLHFGGATYLTNCTSGSCNLYGSATSWATVTRGGSPGIYTLTPVAGEFSAPPVCQFSCFSVTNSVTVGYPTSQPTSTSYPFETANPANPFDSYCEVTCSGPH